MVRSILLRGFDQQMAQIVGDYMATLGTRFIRPATPSKIEKLPCTFLSLLSYCVLIAMVAGKLRVSFKLGEGEKAVEGSEEFDTVMFATGRKPLTASLNLDSAGVKVRSHIQPLPLSRPNHQSPRSLSILI